MPSRSGRAYPRDKEEDRDAIRRFPRGQVAPVHRRRIPGQPEGRPRGLYQWRARCRRHGPPGHAQFRPLAGTALRCAARPEPARDTDLADRYRLGWLYAQIFPRGEVEFRFRRAAGRDRRVGAHVLWLDGAHRRLQGGADEHAWRQCRLVRPVQGERAGLAQACPGSGALHEPRHRQPAHRPSQAGRPGEGRLRPHHQGNRCGHLCVGREGGGDVVGAHALQFPGAETGHGDGRPVAFGDVHRADECTWHQDVLPRLL